MENRPGWKQIWWEYYWGFDILFWLNLVIIIFAIIGFLIAIDEHKTKEEREKKRQADEERKEAKNKTSLKKSLSITAVIVLGVMLAVNFIAAPLSAKHSAKTVEEFLGNTTNKKWYGTNIEKLYQEVPKEEYKIMKIDKIYSLEEDGKEIEEIVYSSDNDDRMLFGSYTIGEKEKNFAHWVKRDNTNKQAHYVRLTVRTPEDNIKKISAVVNLKVADEGTENQALLATTRSLKNDPDDEVYYGEIVVSEKFFE